MKTSKIREGLRVLHLFGREESTSELRHSLSKHLEADAKVAWETFPTSSPFLHSTEARKEMSSASRSNSVVLAAPLATTFSHTITEDVLRSRGAQEQPVTTGPQSERAVPASLEATLVKEGISDLVPVARHAPGTLKSSSARFVDRTYCIRCQPEPLRCSSKHRYKSKLSHRNV